MITAYEARKATEERLKVLAKEFVANKAGQYIQKAIDLGRYDTVINLVQLDANLPTLEATAPEVVKLLQAQGFEAEFYMCEGPRYEATITVKWGNK